MDYLQFFVDHFDFFDGQIGVLCVVGLDTHGEVVLIEEAEPRETPKTHSRIGMIITSEGTNLNTRNTKIPPGVWSFQVVFVNKFNLMEDILLLPFSAVKEGWIYYLAPACEILS